MANRLSALDASFLVSERARTPAQIGSLSVFVPARSGLDYDALVQLIEQRIAKVPRYRQKIRTVPAGITRPVWVDDNDFDISFHVRRSALPAPGSAAQLHELVSRLVSRRLDPARPLWETYLVEGLAHGRVAIISKSHQAMVDGVGALELGHVILDDHPSNPSSRGQLWMPAAEPGHVSLLAEVLGGVVRHPAELVGAVRWIARDVTAAACTVADVATRSATQLRRLGKADPPSPLNVTVSRQRRFATARTDLADYRRVRAARGATINDVVLAVVSGALRSWLLGRGDTVTTATTLRALAPVSVLEDSDSRDVVSLMGAPNSRVSSLLIDLPVGQPNPLLTVAAIAKATSAAAASRRLVGAGTLARLSGFAPPTLHALGARLAGTLARRSFNVLITNVPGPQHPLYADGARLVEMFPVVPLAPMQALTVGITSYDGKLYYGLNADRDALPDVAELAELIEQSLRELVQVVA